MRRVLHFLAALAAVLSCGPLTAQDQTSLAGSGHDKFRQLDEILPTPGDYRTASGAPGKSYWQQRADYRIRAELDDRDQRIVGSQTITYTNNSPDVLRYLWLQLDQNIFAQDSDAYYTGVANSTDTLSFRSLRQQLAYGRFSGGHRIKSVRDAQGDGRPHTIVDTMMRIDPPQPLPPGGTMSFSVDWEYDIPQARVLLSRGGYEFFDADENYLYTIAQWFPRMAAYTDVTGWNNKKFLGDGEFTLEFGDYDVEITAPADHIVSATGELQNAQDVLTSEQIRRLSRARTAKKPVYIVTPAEARANERSRSKKKKTWRFSARNVRDFAFASSRKFIWDAQGYAPADGDDVVMAMSFYPNEASPLWDTYSTASIIHTLEVFGRHLFPYPYPVVQSVSGLVGGMEYPMITFIGIRPTTDDQGQVTYSRTAKYRLISVTIHEVGHNYFPMIINSDERQWTWMDEGLNVFMVYLAEQEWEEGFPSRRGPANKSIEFMTSKNQRPIMTHADSVRALTENAYVKPATALNILRETVMGRELFDFAFREYARRWRFKRPYPADFFRTMEDASGIDLDWFWRGWFYSTDHVDISIDKVTLASVDTRDPDTEQPKLRRERETGPQHITDIRNQDRKRLVDDKPGLKDLYNEYDEFTVTETQRREYRDMLSQLENWEAELLRLGANIYFVQFTNLGGLVMPLILQITYADGAREELRIPAEIWRRDPRTATKMFITEREIAAIQLDPFLETGDADTSNNSWPRKPVLERLELTKDKPVRDLMRELQEQDRAEQ